MRSTSTARSLRLGLFGACLFIVCSMSVANADAPVLEGLDYGKDLIFPIQVKAAYNSDTMFFNIQWFGNRGDTHDYYRYDGTKWVAEGVPRREAESTLDNDPARGPTNRTSTNYESRVSFMVNDPNGPNAVPNFDKVGCFCTCHDDSRGMPQWDPADSHLTKYLNDDTEGTLDMWHHRLARANPIGYSDDFYVTQKNPADPDAGGRHGDAGSGPWKTIKLVDGHPEYMLDTPDHSFDFADLHNSPDHTYVLAGEDQSHATAAWPEGVPFDENVYGPQVDDTIPKRLLRVPTGSRGDISAFGTTFTDVGGLHRPEWVIVSNTQRALDTGNMADDTQLADGGLYDIAFAVHTGMVTIRDHYVSFPLKLKLGDDPNAEIEAAQVAGSGPEQGPDWSTIEATDLNLFLPGITSLEFLDGTLAASGAEYRTTGYDDPNLADPVGQVHGGAFAVGNSRCQNCHAVTNAEAAADPSKWAGAMESLVLGRGGVTTPTPIPEPSTLLLSGFAALMFGLYVGALRKRRRA